MCCISASSCGGGGLSPARCSPSPIWKTLSAHTLAGEIKRISYVSCGKCTEEKGQNAQVSFRTCKLSMTGENQSHDHPAIYGSLAPGVHGVLRRYCVRRVACCRGTRMGHCLFGCAGEHCLNLRVACGRLFLCVGDVDLMA